MRAAVMHRAGDVRIENVPDATIMKPTDAIIRISRACICGSDLWPYNEMQPIQGGRRMGHEAIGVVEAVGSDVRTVKRGDVVVMPFAYSDGTCMFCDEGLQTSKESLALKPGRATFDLRRAQRAERRLTHGIYFCFAKPGLPGAACAVNFLNCNTPFKKGIVVSVYRNISIVTV